MVCGNNTAGLEEPGPGGLRLKSSFRASPPPITSMFSFLEKRPLLLIFAKELCVANCVTLQIFIFGGLAISLKSEVLNVHCVLCSCKVFFFFAKYKITISPSAHKRRYLNAYMCKVF